MSLAVFLGSNAVSECLSLAQAAFLAGVKAKKLLVEAARHFVQVSSLAVRV